MRRLESVGLSVLPAASNIWLRWPYVATCAGNRLEIHNVVRRGDGGWNAASLGDLSLAQWCGTSAASTGRGANAVHGCDIQNGWIACGMASGIVLVLELSALATDGDGTAADTAAAAAAMPPPPPPHAVTELRGHGKVVAFLRLAAHATCLVTSSLDRTCRLWSLPSATCLATIKVGTPVLQLALLMPTASGADAADAAAADAATPRVLMGCGDGTVRLWEPRAHKASKALSTLRHTHKEYVGELIVAPDGSRMLSCSRDGAIMLWRAETGKPQAFVPQPEAVAACDLTRYLRVELLPAAAAYGLVAVTKRGGVDVWAHGASTPLRLVAEALSVPLLDALCASAVVLDDAAPAVDAATLAAPAKPATTAATEATEATEAAPSACCAPWLVFAGCAGAGGTTDADGGALQLYFVRCSQGGACTTGVDGGAAGPQSAVPEGVAGCTISAANTADGALPTGWERWCALAEEEGVAIVPTVQQRLCIMERVAASAGRDLGDASVRAFLRKLK